MKIIKRLSAVIAAVAVVFLSSSIGAVHAAGYTFTPWIYDPDHTGTVVAQVVGTSLHLEKNTATSTNAAAGATIEGVSGLSTQNLTLSFDVNGYCGAGAPRFNVYLSDGSTVFLGCTYGNDGSGHVTFVSGNTYGGVLFPSSSTLTVTGIDIVQDEQGQTTLSNIMVNGTLVTPTPVVTPTVTPTPTPTLVGPPTNKQQCMNGGWRTFNNPSFRNQGLCVSYTNHYAP